MLRVVNTILFLLFLAAVGVFCAQNLQTVRVAYLNWELNAPLPLVVLAVYVLGMLSGWAVVGFVRRSLRVVTTPPEA